MCKRAPRQRDCRGIAETRSAGEHDSGRGVQVARAGQFVEPQGPGIMIGSASEAQRIDEPGRPLRREGLRVQRVPVGCQRGGGVGGDLMSLGDIAHGPTVNLPEGLRKLADIAIALALKPRLLLLDEPTSGVSTAEQFALMNTIVGVLRAEKVTALFVEHDM